MFHYSLFSFFRAHWKISMLSEALSERLLRNKNWPSPKCTVLPTRQNKNTLIFSHKFGCVNTEGNVFIPYEYVENSKITTTALRSRHSQAPALEVHAWSRASMAGLPHTRCRGAASGADTDITCLQTAACTLPDLLQSCSAVCFTNVLKGVAQMSPFILGWHRKGACVEILNK